MQENPINMYLNDVFTVSVNLAGLPGLSVDHSGWARDLRNGSGSLVAPAVPIR